MVALITQSVASFIKCIYSVVRESSFDVVPERELDAPAVDDVETGDRSIFELVS